MKRWFTALAIASVSIGGNAPQALAAEVDMASVLCKDLASASAEDIGIYLMWLHGYNGGKSDDTTVDFDAFEANGAIIGNYCKEHPEFTVMTAVKLVLDK